MITREQIPNVLGHTAYDRSHKKLGQIGHVFLDEETGQPEWFTVRTGLFGKKETFVPLQPAEIQGEDIIVPFQQDEIKDAPNVDAEEGRLPPEEEARLYDYYGMRYQPYPDAGTEGMETGTAQPESMQSEAMPPESMQPEAMQSGTMPTEPETRQAPAGYRAGEGRTDDDAMTRSEEHLRVGRERRETGRARLRKYVTTDYEEHTVPVRRERVRVEHEPITDENRDRATAGPDISEAEHEVTLTEERAVVDKETVPVERVRMEKESVTDEEVVGGQVRKEHIDTEGTEDIDDERRSR